MILGIHGVDYDSKLILPKLILLISTAYQYYYHELTERDYYTVPLVGQSDLLLALTLFVFVYCLHIFFCEVVIL